MLPHAALEAMAEAIGRLAIILKQLVVLKEKLIDCSRSIVRTVRVPISGKAVRTVSKPFQCKTNQRDTSFVEGGFQLPVFLSRRMMCGISACR